MSDRLRFTILGCGSSPGTPRITGDWGACDPANPKNRRTRCRCLVERIAAERRRRRASSSTPGRISASRCWRPASAASTPSLYTHPHADHIHGIDDLRGFWLEQRRLIDVYADQPTIDAAAARPSAIASRRRRAAPIRRS